MRHERSTLTTRASNHSDLAGGRGRPVAAGSMPSAPGQEVHAEVEPVAGPQEVLHLLVGLAPPRGRVEVDHDELGDAAARARARARPTTTSATSALAPLARAAELHHVRAEVVRLDDPGQRAALAQGGDVARRVHMAQHDWRA